MTNDQLGPSLSQDPDPVAAVELRRRHLAARACMGGKCNRREACGMYWAGTEATPRGHIAERACPPGLDQPVRMEVAHG